MMVSLQFCFDADADSTNEDVPPISGYREAHDPLLICQIAS